MSSKTAQLGLAVAAFGIACTACRSASPSDQLASCRAIWSEGADVARCLVAQYEWNGAIAIDSATAIERRSISAIPRHISTHAELTTIRSRPIGKISLLYAGGRSLQVELQQSTSATSPPDWMVVINGGENGIAAMSSSEARSLAGSIDSLLTICASLGRDDIVNAHLMFGDQLAIRCFLESDSGQHGWVLSLDSSVFPPQLGIRLLAETLRNAAAQIDSMH